MRPQEACIVSSIFQTRSTDLLITKKSCDVSNHSLISTKVPADDASDRSDPVVSLSSTEEVQSDPQITPMLPTEPVTPRADNRAFIRDVLSADQANEIVRAAGKLCHDPSSSKFANRTKSIGFVLFLGGQWFQINQNFFNQNRNYNDSSGGYKRFYNELPRSFIQCGAVQILLSEFKKTFDIPDGQFVLVQVQSSNISPDDEGKCLTGQGIHSDGADRAMLTCLERTNVAGARSSVYEDTDGERPIVDRHLLREGSTLFWKDNEIYHYVEPARLTSRQGHGNRTVMIAHYPAMHYITGQANPNNSLPPSGKHPEYLNMGL